MWTLNLLPEGFRLRKLRLFRVLATLTVTNHKTSIDNANNFQSIEYIIYEIIAFLLLVLITIPSRKLFREWADYNSSRNLKDLPLLLVNSWNHHSFFDFLLCPPSWILKPRIKRDGLDRGITYSGISEKWLPPHVKSNKCTGSKWQLTLTERYKTVTMNVLYSFSSFLDDKY